MPTAHLILAGFIPVSAGAAEGSGVGGERVNVGTHSFRLTDEMFQKLAEDYNSSAFQYMTGQ